MSRNYSEVNNMWYPFDDMKHFRKEMNQLFDSFWTGFDSEVFPELKEKLRMRNPLTDMKETESELVAFFEIPGVDKEDIHVKVKENYIEVKAEKKKETKKGEKDYLSASRMYKGFYKSMMLPVKVVPEKVKAHYRDGILEVTMPKAEKGKKKEAKKVTVT